MAAEYVLKEGNERVMLCERGIRTFETAYRFTLDLLAVPALRGADAPAGDRRSEPRCRAARLGPADVAGGGRGRRRRDHRRGPQRTRRGDLRRAAGAADRGVRRVRRAGAPRRRGRGQARRRLSTVRVKVAVLGVGLIGGSIGLAARERLGAEVVGFDPDRGEPRARGRARRARPGRGLDRRGGRGSPIAVVFCAAPVAALPGLVAEALERERAGRGRHRRRLDQARRSSRRSARVERGLALHRRPPARRRRDGRGRERARRPVRGRALVPDPDRGARGRPLRPAPARCSPTSAPGRRRSTPRPTTG